MDLSKAIEILSEMPQPYEVLQLFSLRDAIKLGIEALQRCQDCRPPFGRDDHSLLPSETPEPPSSDSFIVPTRTV